MSKYELQVVFDNTPVKSYKDKVKYIPARPGEAWVTLADISKTTKDTGWFPKQKLESYVKDWLQANT